MKAYYKRGKSWYSYVPAENPNPYLPEVKKIDRDFDAIGAWSAGFGSQVMSYPTVIKFSVAQA